MIQKPSFLILFGILSLFHLTLSTPVQKDPITKSLHSLNLIVDTDIGAWPDDVGAMSMLHTWADEGELKILGIMANNNYEGIVAVLDALNTYFKRPEIEIGITKDPKAKNFTSDLHWPEFVLAHYPHPRYQKNAQAPDAVQLYRKLLSQAPDQSITILSIGYLTNLANLMDSPPDVYSKMTGIELIQSKVKRMVAMAGQYPTGTEVNIAHEARSAHRALPNFPTPVTFVGFEVGDRILCGGNLINPATNRSYNQASPISAMWEIAYRNEAWAKEFGPLDGCFDETAALVAVKGVEPNFSIVRGQIVVAENGTNWWREDPHGRQAYVREAVPDRALVEILNPLLER